MDDLDSLRKYHEQVSRSLEAQIGRLVESQQKTERNVAALTAYTRHAVELDIRAYRRERRQRRKEIRDAEERIAEQRAKDRAEWLERVERTERNLDRLIESSKGQNGSNGSGPKSG